MSSIRIEGNRELCGRIKVQGSKNAALPILAATILIPGTTILENCPAIKDVELMLKLLESMGCHTERNGGQLKIDASRTAQCHLKKEYIEGMRSSIILLGAMLGRFGEAHIGYPGGCVIGERPINYHLEALRALGAGIRIEEGQIIAEAEKLKGSTIHFAISSVGATENAILAAVAAEGMTILENAAIEPEITALCGFLRLAGAKIEGIGTRTLRITGSPLHETNYFVPYDRIVAGTYLLAAAAAGGDVVVEHAPAEELKELIKCLKNMEIDLYQHDDGIEVISDRNYQALPHLVTAEYPGFATDLQPQLAAVLTCAKGNSMIEEKIFDNRFGYAAELAKMGASVRIQDRCLFIKGTSGLQGNLLEAKDLRGGAALILAGLMAEGITRIDGCGFVERGYEDIVRDLSSVGAKISYC